MTLLESISPTSRALLKSPAAATQQVLLHCAASAHRLLAFNAGAEHDEQLLQMTVGCGRLAEATRLLSPEKTALIRAQLNHLAGYGLGWLEAFKSPDEDVIQMVAAERDEQRRLFRNREISFDCASPVIDPKRKLRVLVEEIGEVAEAIDLLECATRHEAPWRKRELQKELVQVVAVCVAWLESLEPRMDTDETRKGGRR